MPHDTEHSTDADLLEGVIINDVKPQHANGISTCKDGWLQRQALQLSAEATHAGR